MSSLYLLFTLTTLLLLLLSPSSPSTNDGDRYVKDACSVTHYQDLCIHSLSSYSNSAKRSPHKWAQAAVSVTAAEAKSAVELLKKVRESGRMRRRQRVALSDCIECFEDTIDSVERSLGELVRLDEKTFEEQMGNVETWMSAALTYEDTCLDGFDGVKRGKQVRQLREKVLRTSDLTSNALALVGKLASVGVRGLSDQSPWK